MVSSKCCQVESPSPLKFLAALMPPWAQTECERFTGTIENRSTCPPISAILMTAESPASPPPTTMILGAAIFPSVNLCKIPIVKGACIKGLLRVRTERSQTRQPSSRHDQKECQ